MMEILKKAFYVFCIILAVVVMCVAALIVGVMAYGFILGVLEDFKDATFYDFMRSVLVLVVFLGFFLLTMQSPNILKWGWKKLRG